MEVFVLSFGPDGEPIDLRQAEAPVAEAADSTAGDGGSFWCECAQPDWDRAVVIPVGHSVDVLCGTCRRYLQVG